MNCQECGFANPPGLVYCGKCGTRLTASPDVHASQTKTIERPQEFLARGGLLSGRFEILEEIGRGGMGTVYRVLDRKIGEEMALKLLNPEVASDHSIIERFKNELKVTRRITHKNVCRTHDIHEDGSTIFVTMEYVFGEDLKSLVSRAGRLSVDRALFVARQIADGLSEAHRLGIVHRDLKPQNIMIDRQGNAKIMDFGIARLLAGPDLTGAGMMIGTPAYMSPEQVDGTGVDPRTDIYALGVILYELVVGRPPFEGDNSLSVALKHKNELPKSPRESNPEIPEELDRLILKCLAKKKEQRFQNAEELMAGLAGGEKGVPLTAPAPAQKAATSLTASERQCIRSIAVLPFKDLSPQHDQDYFCEGLAEELINALTQVNGLKVAARTSSFFFKGKDEDIREIGRRLDVASVLEGSVQKAGNRLRVTAQLICVSDGYHLWSDRYDRKIEDIFAVEDEIALAVVEKLRVELLAGEREKVTKRHTQNKAAYQLYLKGRFHWNKRSPKDMILAVDYFQRAVDKDPEFALPYVGIADVFNMLAEFGFIPPREGSLKSRALLRKAQEIDDSLSELYSSLALITYCYDWDLPAAERLAYRSIELNSRSMWGHAARAEILGTWGRMEEAFDETKKIIESDPLSPLAHALHGIVLGVIGQREEGREKLLNTLAMEPDNPMLNLWLGMIYLIKPALPGQAIEYLRKAAEFGAASAYGYLGLACAMAGQKDEALQCLERLEKVEKESFVPLALRPLLYLKPGLRHFRSFKKKYVPAYIKALVYLGLNSQEEALAQLESSSQARDYLIPVTLEIISRFDLPWIEEFASSPRYQALRAKIKR
jgi:serine/threonine protein kinase/tetratricopeptide (TPR) repeat protein